jgi:hypothetical protein
MKLANRLFKYFVENFGTPKLSRIEVTTVIGCPVVCAPYCPQDVLNWKYKGTRLLTLENLKTLLSTVPKTVEIVFSGFAEPFANRMATDMMRYVYEQKYPPSISTTLSGASWDDIHEVSEFKFARAGLHLLDGIHARWNNDPDYWHKVGYFIRYVRNTSIMAMNDLFVTTNREDTARGNPVRQRQPQFCSRLLYHDFILLPNGDVQFCCMDYGLKCKVGNLFTDSYEILRKRFEDAEDCRICQYCSYNTPYWKEIFYLSSKLMEKMLRD